MNARQKKKLKNRAGFFHYKDYKLRVKLLYHAMDVVMKSSVAYAFKSFMFEHFKGLLLRQAPKKICDRNLRYKPFLTNCVGTSVGRFSDIAKPNMIPSMSMRMVGDKVHSFSIDEDSFKNGYKPGELAPPLPKGPLDGHKSRDAMFPRKYPDTNWPPEGTTVETTISDDEDTQVDVIKREGEPDLTIVHQGLNEDDPVPVVMSESLAKKLKADGSETLVLVEGECTNKRPLSEKTKACMKYHGHVAEDFIRGGQAVEYPLSATIDLRKDEDISGPIHLGPIDLGPTDGELLEEHLLRSEDKKRRFAANACEASADD